jgi:glycerate 2-kinase
LKAADPGPLVRRHLRRRGRVLIAGGVRIPEPRGRLVVVAMGKAAFTMAAAAEDVLGDAIADGIAVGVSTPPALRYLRARAAGHPIPDARGLAAAEEVERLAAGLGRDDLMVVFVSGGASALLPAPPASIPLAEKAALTSALLRAGASIHELNTVRKHLSRLKGGGLARCAAPARVVALVLSDVAGDDLATIASGPVSPDPTTYADALSILAARGVMDIAPAATRHLDAGARGTVPETPKPGDPAFRRVSATVIGSARISVAAAAREARRSGLRPLVLTTTLQGEAREVAPALVSVLRECMETGRPARPPLCLLAAGETTVTVRGDGHGGRNQEMAVAAVEALARCRAPAVFASLATDGVDGRSDAAGGVADARSAARARALGLAPPAAFLATSDSTGFLAPLGDLIVTGPTGTNVVDLTVLVTGGVFSRPRGRGYTGPHSHPQTGTPRRLVG